MLALPLPAVLYMLLQYETVNSKSEGHRKIPQRNPKLQQRRQGNGGRKRGRETRQEKTLQDGKGNNHHEPRAVAARCQRPQMEEMQMLTTRNGNGLGTTRAAGQGPAATTAQHMAEPRPLADARGPHWVFKSAGCTRSRKRALVAARAVSIHGSVDGWANGQAAAFPSQRARDGLPRPCSLSSVQCPRIPNSRDPDPRFPCMHVRVPASSQPDGAGLPVCLRNNDNNQKPRCKKGEGVKKLHVAKAIKILPGRSPSSATEPDHRAACTRDGLFTRVAARSTSCQLTDRRDTIVVFVLFLDPFPAALLPFSLTKRCFLLMAVGSCMVHFEGSEREPKAV